MRYVRHLPNNKTLLTEEVVISLGLTEDIYPVNEVLPSYNPAWQGIHPKPISLWKFENGEYTPTYYIRDLDVTHLKRQLKEKVTAKRWELMTGGFTLPNGTVINTTVEDQNRISSVVANAHLAGLDDSSQVDFKATKGWVQISIGELKNVVGLIGVFTQLLYSGEKEHHEIIDSLSTGEEITQYDINIGWPSNGAEV